MSRIPDGYARVRVRLDWLGASPAAMPWPKYRAFMDALIDAVGSLEGGPVPSQVIAAELREGSVMPELHVVESCLLAFRRLAKGPSRDWSATERAGLQRLHDFARGMQIDLFQIQAGKGRFITMKPPQANTAPRLQAPTTYRQSETVAGRVLSVGGAETGALVETRRGRVQCDADFALTCELGRHLYRRVQVAGVAIRNLSDHALVAFEARRLVNASDAPTRPGEKRPGQAQTIREIRELLGDQWAGRSVSQILGEES